MEFKNNTKQPIAVEYTDEQGNPAVLVIGPGGTYTTDDASPLAKALSRKLTKVV